MFIRKKGGDFQSRPGMSPAEVAPALGRADGTFHRLAAAQAVGVTGDHRAARYLLPLPVVGAGTSIYHLLIENHVIKEPTQCVVSAPGGCAVKWINEFGYITIPTLALTGFLLLIGFLVLAATGVNEETATLPAHAER